MRYVFVVCYGEDLGFISPKSDQTFRADSRFATSQ